jgi:hypothetical protein
VVVAEGRRKEDAGAVKKYQGEKRSMGRRSGKNIMTILRFINNCPWYL